MNPDGNGSPLEKYASSLPLSGVGNEQESQKITPQLQTEIANEPQQVESMLFVPETNEEKKKNPFFIAWAKRAVKTGERVVEHVSQKAVEPIVEKTEEVKETYETWKEYIKTFGLPATIIAAVVGGFIYWRAKSGDLNPNLGEDFSEGIEKIWKIMTRQRIVNESDKPSDIVKGEDHQRYLNNYIDKGMNDPMVNIAPVTEISHFSQIDKMTELTAAAGGPSWMLPVIEKEGQVRSVATASMLAEQLAGQLIGATKQEILDNWIKWHNDPQAFLDFLSSHGANQQVVNNYQCAIQVAQADTISPDTWTDRLDATHACLAKKQGIVPTETAETHGKFGLVASAEVKQDNSLQIATRIVEESLKIEGVAVQPLIAKAVEVAQDLVINHQLPARDDVQDLFSQSIEIGSRIISYLEDLPRDVQMAVETGVHHQIEADHDGADYIYPDASMASLGTADSLGGMVLMVVALGVATVHAARLIKRDIVVGRTPEPVIKKSEAVLKAVRDMLAYEKKENRGMPDRFISVGKLCETHVISTLKTGKSNREVVAEVIIEADKVIDNGGDGSPEYKQLIVQLRKGIKNSALELLRLRKLLIQNEKLATPLVKAMDLMQIIFELEIKGQYSGELLAGEPDYYD